MREEILIKKLQNGDASALDELISMYYQEILRYCIWHVLIVVYANCDMYSPVYMGS